MLIIGSVFSNNGTPLPLANVYISNAQGAITGAARGTTTNIDGDYMLDVAIGEYITASFIGYTRQTKQVGADDGIISFALETDNQLNEVTVTANKPRNQQPVNWKLIVAALIVAAIIYYYLN